MSNTKDTDHKPTMAFEATVPGAKIVGVGNLRVLLSDADGTWFAQGLEIDYAAQGESESDVQSNFERGLTCTINEHLRVYGTIKKLLRGAPPEAWRELLEQGDCLIARHSQVSFHGLPFSGVEYYEKKAA